MGRFGVLLRPRQGYPLDADGPKRRPAALRVELVDRDRPYGALCDSAGALFAELPPRAVRAEDDDRLGIVVFQTE